MLRCEILKPETLQAGLAVCIGTRTPTHSSPSPPQVILLHKVTPGHLPRPQLLVMLRAQPYTPASGRVGCSTVL